MRECVSGFKNYQYRNRQIKLMVVSNMKTYFFIVYVKKTAICKYVIGKIKFKLNKSFCIYIRQFLKFIFIGYEAIKLRYAMKLSNWDMHQISATKIYASIQADRYTDLIYIVLICDCAKIWPNFSIKLYQTLICFQWCFTRTWLFIVF